MSKRTIQVALAGNPNSGKSSIFNYLTGMYQHIANYPGVTVETRFGRRVLPEVELNVFDLPGTYNLTAHTPEEQIARDHLLSRGFDVVVQVVDASSLERSLYLTTQLLEIGCPLVLDLNMIDEARRRGFPIDPVRLSERLGIDVVETVGNRGLGVTELVEAIQRTAGRPRPSHGDGAGCCYEEPIEQWVRKVADHVQQFNGDGNRPPRWTAVKFLEGDPEVHQWLMSGEAGPPDLLKEAWRSVEALTEQTGDSPEGLLAQARYGIAADIYHAAQTGSPAAEAVDAPELSEQVDAILLHRWLGFPIFLGLMFVLFQFVFTLGEPLMLLIETGFGWLGAAMASTMPPGPLRSLLVDGVIGGVGGVLVFLPNIVLLFIGIGLMERSGYMARAAFLMDRIMHKIGLHGRSFIPMLTGFGCSVPAIMATRTLEHERDRLATMMVIPLMSCSARLPIYTLIIPAFFPMQWRGAMFFVIYMIGILMAIVLVKLLRVTVLTGQPTPFLMELPPYRWPTFRSVVLDMGHKSWLYLKKAGTIVLAISMLMWAATSFPPVQHPATEMVHQDSGGAAVGAPASEVEPLPPLADTIAGRIGRGLEVVFRPAGFDWEICTALIGAFAAKEVFVAQLGIVYSLSEQESSTGRLRAILARNYTPLQGFCVMLFCLIGAPCMATVAITRRESHSWRWALIQFFGLTAVAYVLTVIVYQAGSALGLGG